MSDLTKVIRTTLCVFASNYTCGFGAFYKYGDLQFVYLFK